MVNTANGSDILETLKEIAGRPGPQLVLRVGSPPIAYLRPVATKPSLQNDNDITLLTRWRNKHPNAFLTEFNATTLQTSNWLSSTVHNDNGRILFMVDDNNGDTIGYMGLAYIDWDRNYGEADAVVRGKPASKGLMRQCLLSMLSWAAGQLALDDIGVRVLSDNPALEFYRKCSFVETKRVPLSRKHENGKVIWFEDELNTNPDRTLVYQLLKKSD